MSVQPSEFAKLGMIVVLAAWMARVGRRSDRFREGFMLPVMGLGVVLALIILEPDFGTTLVTGAVGMAMLFVAGTRLSHLLVAGALGLSGFILAVMRDPVRTMRILAFVMPEQYPEVARHLAQSKIAFIRGGLFGVGLGNSIQKQFYLPEAHTDFILAIVGEELGFIATVVVAALFLGFVICGMVISFRAQDIFGRLLGFGITMMIALQAAINIGVVTGCLPTKGLPLPFISYGGSSLLVSVAGVCILLNIAQHHAVGDAHTRSIKDSGHRF
jgi:cell division protein FtsW